MQDVAGNQRFYGPKADIWSLGAILYYMVYGIPPPYHSLAANPPLGQFPHPDPALNDILRQTLVLSPRARADINTLLFHPFTQS
jgi:serine/threonine protein kinase